MDMRNRLVGNENQRIRIEKPSVRNSEDESLSKEIRKYIALIPSEPNPNLGRVREIKEEIAKGTYITRDKIDEVATQLAIRFLKGE